MTEEAQFVVPRGSTGPAILFAMLACGLIAVGVLADQAWPQVAAGACAFVAAAGWFARERGWTGRFGEHALEVESNRPLTARYEDIHVVVTQVGTATRSSPVGQARGLFIQHSGDWVVVPSTVMPRIERIWPSLLSRVGVSRSRISHPDLVAFAEENDRLFGCSRVFAFAARRQNPPRHSRQWRAIGISMIAAAVASTILMTFIGEDAAAPCMLFSLIGIGVLVLLFSQIGAGRISNKLVTSQLVVAPSGLALYQGDLCGKLRWEELKRVRLGSAASGRYSSDGSHRGLVLEVEGAAISIANVYDRPLELIYRLVMIYWKGGLACGHCKHAMTPAEGPLCVHCETSVTAAPDMLTSVDA